VHLRRQAASSEGIDKSATPLNTRSAAVSRPRALPRTAAFSINPAAEMRISVQKDRKIEVRNPQKVDRKRGRDRLIGNGEEKK
jgi:hypothetical protein